VDLRWKTPGPLPLDTHKDSTERVSDYGASSALVHHLPEKRLVESHSWAEYSGSLCGARNDSGDYVAYTAKTESGKRGAHLPRELQERLDRAD
jgi:hypothetical protein